MKDHLYPRPFLKWAGGKSQLTEELVNHRPPTFTTYHEPFVGGGALFFHLFRAGKIQRAVLSDINAELVDTYLAIRDHAGEVIRYLAEFPHSKEFYYQLRSKDPQELSLPERAARMIYLNKTGYNGLYRVNRQGQFNVPYGRYKSPRYLDRENLLAVSWSLQNVDILCASFETVLERACAGDWVYFDPPYVPLSQTAHFTSYHSSGFDVNDQAHLRDVCLALTEAGVYVTVSNSDTPTVHALYGSPPFSFHRVWASRSINCNGKKRGKVSEGIITNYPVKSRVRQLPLEVV